MKKYLNETPSIDYMNPIIQEKVQELRNQSSDDLDYIEQSYLFVRDEIPHSWDIGTNIVSKTASEVLIKLNRNVTENLASKSFFYTEYLTYFEYLYFEQAFFFKKS